MSTLSLTLSYLGVSVRHPSPAWAASYRCEVNGLDSQGHPVVVTVTRDVDIKEASLNEVVGCGTFIF